MPFQEASRTPSFGGLGLKRWAQLPPGADVRGHFREGIQYQAGTNEVGKQADMVLIDGDPMSDPAALRNIWAVCNNQDRIIALSSTPPKVGQCP